MSLAEHLAELRSRVIRSALAIAAAGVVAWVFYRPIFRVMTHPYCALPVAHRLGGRGCDLIVTGVLDAFTFRLHLVTYVAVVLAAPVWLYQLWAFVTPALYQRERRYALTFVGSSLLLFGGGATFAYFALGKALHFLLGFATGGLTPLIRVDSYLSFLTTLLLVFGVSFEFPLLVIALNATGMLSYRRLRRWRRAEIFLVFVFAAAVVPSGDPFTMTAMAVPMALLYEVALLVARAHDRRVEARRLAADVAVAPAGAPASPA
jgi:sec-independent protein translocase protein TatC